MAAYVRKKKVKDGEYYQLVESRRVDGKPRQKVLLHLGRHPTVDAALKNWPREVKRLRRLAARKRRDAEAAGGYRDPNEQPAWIRDMLKRADNLEKEADNLEAKRKTLRHLRSDGVVK